MSAALKFQMIDEPLPIDRMCFNDIEEHAVWLSENLLKRYPLATVEGTKMWLRGCISMNEMWFVKSGGAIALAKLVREPLGPPRAEEVFMLCRDVHGSFLDGLNLYVAMTAWAKGLGCTRLDVEIFSDVPPGDISKRLGRPKTRPGMMVVL